MSVIVRRALVGPAWHPIRGAAWLLACALLVFSSAETPRAAETGELPGLRAQALELVNAARREHGREPLTLSDPLDQAAQDHAEDMLARAYYAHVSPEGEDARDRYLARGGDRGQLVAENIANCSPCAVVPGAEQVEEMHRRWMDSPPHRENILSAGITQFGFGIVAGAEGPLYAVQTFAGPGTPDGTAGDTALRAILRAAGPKARRRRRWRRARRTRRSRAP